MTEGNGVESLGGGCYAAISEEHRFGTDAFLLSDFIRPKKSDRAADLGTGCGIIPLLWHRKKLCDSILGLELQQNGADLAAKGVALSGAEEKIRILRGDLRDHRSLFSSASFDLVTCNPPIKHWEPEYSAEPRPHFPPGTSTTAHWMTSAGLPPTCFVLADGLGSVIGRNG